MRIRYLQYFLIVAEELSFARAADRVHIEPSPLSRAIKELEAHLQVSLLHRGKGRIRLTLAGEAFREEAERIISFIEDAKTRVQSADKGFHRRLRIGLADSLAQPHLTRLLARCREEEPRTEIRLFEMTASDMMKAIEHDQIDAGFTVHADAPRDIVKKAVWSDRPTVAVPRNHPLLSLDEIPLQEVAGHPLILCHPKLCSGGYDVICRWFHSKSLPAPDIAQYVSGHEPMMMMVAAGYGIGLGLESQITIYRHPDVIVRPVTNDIPSASTFIAMLDKPHSDELHRFVVRAMQIGEKSQR